MSENCWLGEGVGGSLGVMGGCRTAWGEACVSGGGGEEERRACGACVRAPKGPNRSPNPRQWESTEGLASRLRQERTRCQRE